MQGKNCIIKKQFLSFSKYEELIQQTQVYQSLFKNWLIQILENYKGPSKPNILMAAVGKNMGGNIQKLQNQVYPLVHTLNDISSQHLGFVSQILRQSAYNSLQKDSDKIKQLARKLDETQTNFQGSFRQLLSSENRLILHPTSNIEYYFYSNWLKRLNSFERYIKSTKNLQQNKSNIDIIYKLSQKVEIQILQLRKKVMNFKYGYLKQGVKIARKMLDCLSQYLTVANQMMLKINGKLRIEMTNGLSSSGRRYPQNQQNQFQQNYAPKVQAYRQILVNIQNIFVYNLNTIDPQNLFTQFKEAYAGNQELIREMFDVFTLFENVGMKKRIIYQRINMLIKKMQLDYIQKRKSVQILNTLSRKKSQSNLTNNLKQISQNQQKLRKSQSIIKQFEIQNNQKLILQVIQFGMQTFRELSQLCYKTTQKSTTNRNSQNNMQISYIYKQIIIKNKRPSRNQLWLWRDYREFKTFQQIKPKYEQKFITQEINKIKYFMNKQEADLVASCYIQGRHSGKASLQILPQKLIILNQGDNYVNIILPMSKIQSIQSQKKQLTIKMNTESQLKLNRFKNINQVQNLINQFMAKKQQNEGKEVSHAPVKANIQISQAQLQAIKKRQPEMSAQRQKITSEYEKIGEKTFNNVTIQQFYENLYSDKSSCPLSKTMSFIQYINIKSGNINFIPGKSDKQGPYFYTGTNKQITFQNCPIFSSRKIQLQHFLPPVPFIPKTCKVKSQQQIFWISNKQLQYKITSYSYGASMMQTFYTVIFHKIKQLQQGAIHLQIYCKVIFFKETRMKTILYNGGMNQLKSLIPQLLIQMQKCMKIVIRERNKQKNKIIQNGFPTMEIQQKQQIQQLSKTNQNQNIMKQGKKQNINMFLVALAIGTVIINLLITFAF